MTVGGGGTGSSLLMEREGPTRGCGFRGCLGSGGCAVPRMACTNDTASFWVRTWSSNTTKCATATGL